MRRPTFLWLVVVGALAVVTYSVAEAADLALDVTGELGPTTTLNGTALSANTPFSFHAVFDPMDNVNPTPGAGYFRPLQFTIEIAGHGTFAGVPNVDLNVVVLDPTYHLNVYAAGLVTSTGSPFFLNTYSAVATPYNPSAPTPTTFLNYLGTLDSFDDAPYVMPLAGGAGYLVINDFGSAVPSASLVAVPEPSLLRLAGLCGTALVAGGRRIAVHDHRVDCNVAPSLCHKRGG